ncbi:glycosyltransferase family 32 protein [Acinetobacter sp. A2]|uniref:glycosyltransferase family 32 protein n=1 Tax=Acinetobacter sp. A2 TaxID=362457 RepID=UPI003AF3EAA5
MSFLKNIVKLFLAFINFIFYKPKFFEKTKLNKLSENNIPRVIWLYWDSPVKNNLVEICINRVKEICRGYEVIILDEKNVNEYIDLIEFNENLTKAHIADYIRLKILSVYGGIWIDASTYLVENLDWILNYLNDDEVFLFYSDQCTKNKNKPIYENWFIVANKNNILINNWLNEYLKCITSFDPFSYYSSVYSNKEIMQNIKINFAPYLICYIALSIIINSGQYKVKSINSGSQGHYYNYKNYFNGFLISCELLLRNKKNIYTPKMIKFTGVSRRIPNFFIQKKIYNRKSLIGSYIAESLNDY